MWFFIISLVLARLWIVSFFLSSLHLFFFSTLLYGLFYAFRSSHHNGHWQWQWFRSLSLWDRVRSKHFSHAWHQITGWREFQRHGEAYLFIVVSSSPTNGKCVRGTCCF